MRTKPIPPFAVLTTAHVAVDETSHSKILAVAAY